MQLLAHLFHRDFFWCRGSIAPKKISVDLQQNKFTSFFFSLETAFSHIMEIKIFFLKPFFRNLIVTLGCQMSGTKYKIPV